MASVVMNSLSLKPSGFKTAPVRGLPSLARHTSFKVQASGVKKIKTDTPYDKPEFRIPTILPSKKTLLHRRHVLVCAGASLVTLLTLNRPLTSSPAWAAESATSQEDKDETVVDAIKSLFDPDEKTKSGKVLPKAYLKSAREVVKTLRESVNEDPKDNAKFRRTADAAKASIRDYLGNWRGNQVVFKEESYVMLEKAIRSLASFYSKAGPSAALPEEVKSDILYDLNTAEEFL